MTANVGKQFHTCDAESEKACRNEPDGKLGHMLGDLLEKEGQIDEAIEAGSHYVERYSQDSQAALDYCQLLVKAEKFELNAELCRKQLNPLTAEKQPNSAGADRQGLSVGTFK